MPKIRLQFRGNNHYDQEIHFGYFLQKQHRKSPLKEKIKSPEELLKTGVVTNRPESKNQPYDELYQYIDTFTISEKIKKVAKITYLNPEDSIKINPEWLNGAIEIDAVIE